jgi:N-acetylmuramoyl-L-alanine amidase
MCVSVGSEHGSGDRVCPGHQGCVKGSVHEISIRCERPVVVSRCRVGIAFIAFVGTALPENAMLCKAFVSGRQARHVFSRLQHFSRLCLPCWPQKAVMLLRSAILALCLTLFSVMSALAGPRYFEADQTPFPRLKPAAASVKTIVIDPGHGGRDPGAIGQKGTYEKTITTAAAQELKALLEATGRYRVLLTRMGDTYVKHDDRVRFAREKQADLFISIHADSAPNSNTRGASVYTLADRARGRSRRIVNNQNWIMDVDLSEQSDPVGDILVDLAQRNTENQSEAFANFLLQNLEGKTKLVTNSHRRAGYYVLLAPDVPAVLLELGFLSNIEDEKLLKKKSHRTKMLKAVRLSVDQYFSDAAQRG